MSSFEEILELVYKDLRLYVIKVLMKKQNVEDYVQNIILHIHKNKKKYEKMKREELYNYCKKSIKNIERSEYTTRGRHLKKQKEIYSSNIAYKKNIKSIMSDKSVAYKSLNETNKNLEREKTLMDRKTKLDFCIKKLSIKKRETISLQKAGNSYAKIADYIKIPIGSVMSNLARAKLELKKCLEGFGMVGLK